jgi:hypothetical protein
MPSSPFREVGFPESGGSFDEPVTSTDSAAGSRFETAMLWALRKLWRARIAPLNL